MTTGARTVSLTNGKLMVSGQCVLSDVHDNVTLTPVVSNDDVLCDGAFIGVKSDHKGSLRVFPVGKLLGLRFMSLYRFKMWWMTQWMGVCGCEIPFETQFLLVEVRNSLCLDNARTGSDGIDKQEMYIVFLPLLEGDFRAVLQGNEQNEMVICLESGDPAIDTFDGSHLVFAASGSNPFDVVTFAVKTVEKYQKTFCHLERKKIPDMINWFGWCTWDAFYTDVTEEGLNLGLESFKKGGIAPKFLIIDDGWQSVAMDPTGIESKAEDTANFADRLVDIKENHKFRKHPKEGHVEKELGCGLQRIIAEIKEQYGLKYVYVWHAITGYWGGVKPNSPAMESYEANLVYPMSSAGVEVNGVCNVLESIMMNGVGLVKPEKAYDFYNDLHSYLASTGVDGVKVDAQTILETLGKGYGGRVNLARKYHEALEASIARNFSDNDIISCMSHNTDGLYSEKKTAIMRASDDFFPRDPASHTIHVASVAYNSTFVGEFMQPDWDMFHSQHPMAEYHGAARAVSGCAIYVSDKPECHDFNLLKKLSLPDGSILRAKLPGRPTGDCLFSDPARDKKSLLKIWNLNSFSGVIGVFNCQGAGWCRVTKKPLIHEEHVETLTGSITAKDVDYLPRVADDGWSGDTIAYSHRGGEVVYLLKNSSYSIVLNPREYEVFTVVPVKSLSNGAKFAPIGLLEMFNSGGAISDLKYELDEPMTISMRVRGCGMFGAYSLAQPKRVLVESREVPFEYRQGSGLVTFALEVPDEDLYHWSIVIKFEALRNFLNELK